MYSLCSPLPSRSPAEAHNTPTFPYIHDAFPMSNYCEVPLAKSFRRQEIGVHLASGFHDLSPAPIHPHAPSRLPLPSPTTPIPPKPASSSRSHVPRPPNAFMIYRSELIKSRSIPEDVEHRQQNISRLAGECWNLLSPEEKAKYHEKAAEVLREHQRLNPDYKFTPAPRGSRRSKTKTPTEVPSDDSQRLRRIRETYIKVLGPSKVAQRRRKRKTVAKERTLGFASSGPSSPDSIPPPSTPGSDEQHTIHPSPASLPYDTLPRCPSTSLGFVSSAPSASLQDFPQIMNTFNSSQPYLPSLDPPQLVHPDTSVLPFNFGPQPLFGVAPHFGHFIQQGFSDFTQLASQGMLGPSCGVDTSPFTLNLDVPSEVPPLEVGSVGNVFQGSIQSFQWKEVDNPSDDINYAVEQAFSSPPSPDCPIPSPQ